MLVIRGDAGPRPASEGRTVNETGLDLVRQVTAMNRGVYLEELVESTPTDFCIGVAAYPEKHVEAPNFERDIAMLLEKQRSGAHYAVTQIFYDNELYFRFVKACRDQASRSPSFRGSRSSRGGSSECRAEALRRDDPAAARGTDRGEPA